MTTRFETADRMQLPGYPFAALERKAAEIRASGKPLYDLSIGDPDLPPPVFVTDAVKEAMQDDRSHRYPSSRGDSAVRESVARWFKARFKVDVDPSNQVCILIGAKEGLSHIAQAVVNPGDIVAVPDPAYPVYWRAGCRLIGGKLKVLPLVAEKGFLPDLDMAFGARLLYLNYPNNPTGAMAPDHFLEHVAESIEANPGMTVAYDMAYSEMTFGERARSLLEFTADAVEFHSLSKMANATGFRVGFAVGSEDRISALIRVKEEIDSGVPLPFQKALAAVLDKYEGAEPPVEIRRHREIYRARREKLFHAFEQLGLDVFKSDATFYVWFRVGDDEMDFVTRAMEAGILLTPGSGFGEGGRGWVRASATAPDEAIDRAVSLLKGLI